jgi:two-component system response regulator NreC
VTTVLLVDDHAIVRSGVRRMLTETDEFEIIGETGDASEAVRMARRHKPDVVVLDIGLKTSSGLEIIEDIRQSGARIVILSMQDEPAYARQAFERGAQGYVLKDAADEDLATAIRAVLADRVYVHPSLAARLVVPQPEDDLTARQREILRLIALGYTNQEIAELLYLSVRTIEAHRRHVLDKLQLQTRAELVGYAIKHRVVDIGL